jgi:hypothetical protein
LTFGRSSIARGGAPGDAGRARRRRIGRGSFLRRGADEEVEVPGAPRTSLPWPGAVAAAVPRRPSRSASGHQQMGPSGGTREPTTTSKCAGDAPTAGSLTCLRHGGPVWQGSGSSKNSSGSGSAGGVASLVELEPFWKTFGKTASPVGLRL